MKRYYAMPAHYRDGLRQQRHATPHVAQIRSAIDESMTPAAAPRVRVR